ncbi:A-kinase anchor protein 12 [Mastacembelus armatus]|uniref:A-kinase anchor protein 12 n=1 Tax=Mastacembelus armatus TaxID=205130 RepID=UPI000E45CB1D|nr:A-kinase anchor protein 12-like [Mastacembelus armatus]
MGAAQSAQRDDKKDSAAEEETGSVDDAQAEQRVEDELLKKNGQISELNGKADSPITEEDGHCEDETAAEAILSPEDVSEAEQPLKEKRPKTEMDENESSNQGDANEVPPMKMTEIDGKQNEINEGLGRFFSNIGFKSTLKRGSAEKADESTNKKTNRLEDTEDAAKETKNDNAEHNTDLNDSTCPTLTDITSQDVPVNQEEKTEIKEEAQLDNGGETTTSPVGEDDATPEEEVVVSPIKRFFTTGIFSGLRKKKQLQSIDTNEKELLDNGKMEVTAKTEQTLQQEDTEEISLGVEAATAETEHKDNEHQEEILSATSTQTTDEAISPSTDPTIIVSEPEILNSQEKDKVQASPLKKLMSGSSLKKLSKKPRGRKSSDAKLSDSGEHVSDQLLSSTKSADNQKEESHAGEEEGAWASFKKLVTPKKHVKRSSLTNEETLIPSSAQESKPGDGEQISDHSTDEGKKRKDSSVSWEAVLCGSGRRRSRKTSDSEDEVPQVENGNNKQESPLESSNDGDEISTCYPKQVGSPSEGDGGSTWKSFKKLVTPKRKVKNQDDNEIIQSDSEVTQDESSSAIKKLLPGRTKKRPAEKQDQVSSDEADKEITSDDEDTETPAVVPLSEFDTAETGDLQTKADVESHVPNEADDESQQNPLDQPSEPGLPCDSLQSEAKNVQDDKNALENESSATLVLKEEREDFTEFISKHQQLSDIPEEGVITETMATPPSVAEEPARDDTIAEDLIEITSEAITAPEPVDITIADETEMISAVSQLSESSKTSGNTTPVPAEYEVKDTELVLQQVVETISISPKVALVCSDELSSERIVASVSHQILETFTKQETTILEIHSRSEAIDISTGLNVKELDAISEFAATAQTESISKVKEAVSNEIVSNDPTEQFETAGIAVDDVHVVNVKHPQERIKELESTNEIHGQVECQTEASSTDILLESEDTVAGEGLAEAHQAERKSSHSDFHDADSAAPVSEETKTGAADTEVQTMSETKDEITQIFTDQVQAEDQDQPPAVTAEEEATLNSVEGTFQLTVKEVGPEDIAAVETITDEHTEEVEPFTEVSTEPEKEDELQTDAAEVKDDQVTEVVQVAAVDLEMVCIQTSKKETQLPKETVTDEPKQTAKDLTEVCAGPENTESPVDDRKIEHYQAKEVLEDVQVPTLDLEEGSVHPLKQEVRSETSPVVETDESKEETESLTEVSIKSVGDSKNEHVQDPDVLETVQVVKLYSNEVSVVTFEKEETAAETPPIESVADKPTKATEGSAEPEEELPTEHVKTEQLQEPDVSQCDGKDTIAKTETEEAASISEHGVSESVEEGSAYSAEEPEIQKLLDDAPNLNASVVIVSITDKSESESELNQALKINKDQKTESITEDSQVKQEDRIPEAVDKLQPLSTVHISSANVQPSGAEVLEKTVISEETPASCVDSALVTYEPKHDMHLSEVQVSVEAEKQGELPDVEIKTAAAEHAIVAQVTTCSLKEVLAAIPSVLLEETDSQEPLMDMVARQLEFKEEVEASAPLVKEDVTEVAKEESVVVMMHVPSVEFEDSHSIEVQVVDVNIKSPEMTVDSGLEVGVTEPRQVIDVCHVTVKPVDNLSATQDTELNNEENKVNIKEVIQHIKENLPEGAPESLVVQSSIQDEVVDLKKEDIIQPDDLTEVNETAENESNQHASEDLMQTPNIEGTSDVSIHDLKEELEDCKAELEQSVAEEAKESELDMKKTNGEAQIPQISQIVIPSNDGLVVPQNNTIISSVGNLEPPSCLSLELKLNIQFGQTKAPASPPPTTDRTEPVSQTDESGAAVRTEEIVEPEEPVEAKPRAESQKQTALCEVSVQATGITETELTNSDSIQTAVIMNQPVLLDISIQAMETAELAEHIKSTGRVTRKVALTETSVCQTEERELFLSQPVLSEACDKETKAQEPVKQREEENEQDVWMDAEEDIDTVAAHHTEDDQEVMAGPEHELDLAPSSKTKEEGQQPHKTAVMCETANESEDFAVALQHSQTATASVATLDWD